MCVYMYVVSLVLQHVYRLSCVPSAMGSKNCNTDKVLPKPQSVLYLQINFV